MAAALQRSSPTVNEHVSFSLYYQRRQRHSRQALKCAQVWRRWWQRLAIFNRRVYSVTQLSNYSRRNNTVTITSSSSNNNDMYAAPSGLSVPDFCQLQAVSAREVEAACTSSTSSHVLCSTSFARPNHFLPPLQRPHSTQALPPCAGRQQHLRGGGGGASASAKRRRGAAIPRVRGFAGAPSCACTWHKGSCASASAGRHQRDEDNRERGREGESTEGGKEGGPSCRLSQDCRRRRRQSWSERKVHV